MDDALKARGSKHLNVVTWQLFFAPPYLLLLTVTLHFIKISGKAPHLSYTKKIHLQRTIYLKQNSETLNNTGILY